MGPWSSIPEELKASCGTVALLLLGAAMAPSPVQAAVTISGGATQNMSCSGDVCEPTSADAVFNVGNLETMLASGDATVTTTGKGVEANNLVVAAALSWVAANTLTLAAHNKLKIERPISVAGSGGLSLAAKSKVGSGTELSFGPHGGVSFGNLSSSLLIDGTSYTLIDTIAQLAKDIATNPAGTYALAAHYNAKHDGTYTTSPISTPFNGIFEGLGNTVSDLTIADSNTNDLFVGLFSQLLTNSSTTAQIRDLGVTNANVSAVGGALFGDGVGALLGDNAGGIINGCFSTGSISGTGEGSAVGGLVGGNGAPRNKSQIANSFSSATVTVNDSTEAGVAGGLVGGNVDGGVIRASHATGSVTGGNNHDAGGLVGVNVDAQIRDSYALGTVAVGSGQDLDGAAGGLVGYHQGNIRKHGRPRGNGLIINSYSMGAVSGGDAANVGGLVGVSAGGLAFSSYSTGQVGGGSGAFVGGFVGYDYRQESYFESAYWDTDTSGITNLGQGAGSISNDPGITGLTTTQFLSGLPNGLSPKVWAENPNINAGFPFLRENPPPK